MRAEKANWLRRAHRRDATRTALADGSAAAAAEAGNSPDAADTLTANTLLEAALAPVTTPGAVPVIDAIIVPVTDAEAPTLAPPDADAVEEFIFVVTAPGGSAATPPDTSPALTPDATVATLIVPVLDLPADGASATSSATGDSAGIVTDDAAIEGSVAAAAVTELESPIARVAPVAPAEPETAAPPSGPATQTSQTTQAEKTASAWRRFGLAARTQTRIVAVLATALSVGAFIWYYVNGYTLTYSDAVSHMMIARRVIFARTPGLGQLGSVWPPFNHLLMLPFIWIDPLYRSGLAGALPSMVCYVVATVYLFRIGRLLFSSVLAGWVAAALFALNPNVLYMQSTPMSELVLLCTITVGLFYLFRWVQTDHALDLLLCAGAFAAGTLVRYDAWALAGAELLVIAYITWRRHGIRAVEGTLWMYGLLAFIGCVGWFFYNWILYGDPLYFMDGPYSASYQQQNFLQRGALPTYHNLVISLREYAQAAADNVGWPLLALAAGALVLMLLRERFAPRMLPVYAVWSLTLFNILCLLLGITVIYTPQLHLPLATGYANIRYGIMVVPEVALFVASLVGWRRELAVIGLGLAVVFSGLNPTLGLPYTLRDPLHSTDWTAARAQAQWLDQHYTGGAILIGGSSSTTLVFSTGLPDQDILNENTPADFNQAIAAPQKYVTWIVMDDTQQPVYDAVYARLAHRQYWRKYFVLRATIDGMRFYQRIGGN